MLENQLASYDYFLPQNLIATKPTFPKHRAKLLIYHKKEDKITHTNFKHFFDFIPKDSLVVLNDTKVIPARIYGKKQSGGKIELLYHKNTQKEQFLVQIKGKTKIGDKLSFDDDLECKILQSLQKGLKIVEFYQHNQILNTNSLLGILGKIGHTPLPPYIKRQDEASDAKDYQSIFAKNLGSIAAPTASLHFDDDDKIRFQRFNHCFLTLHIGAGTFFNVETDDITKHTMHKEIFYINPDSRQKINKANKILCIGTTATRCVEYYAKTNIAKGECDIFINPLNPPLKTNYLLTNFHLPKSTLLMLVAGFIGIDKTKEIYEIAKKNNYLFYSYGDGMLIV